MENKKEGVVSSVKGKILSKVLNALAPAKLGYEGKLDVAMENIREEEVIKEEKTETGSIKTKTTTYSGKVIIEFKVDGKIELNKQ